MVHQDVLIECNRNLYRLGCLVPLVVPFAPRNGFDIEPKLPEWAHYARIKPQRIADSFRMSSVIQDCALHHLVGESKIISDVTAEIWIELSVCGRD